MIHTSRPLRFLAVVIGGWAGARALVLWPVQVAPAFAQPVASGAPTPAAIGRAGVRLVAWRAPRPQPARLRLPMLSQPVAADPSTVMATEAAAAGSVAFPATPIAADVALPPDPAPPGVDPPPVFRASQGSGRWSGSAWAILRPDGRATPFASQLGGSQAGARIAYALDGARRVALYARASTAIDAAEREAAVGVDWRPTRLPIHLIAERRIGIEGVRNGTAIGAVGGVGPTRVAGPIRVEGYAQGGVIFRDGREGFFDGSLRVTAPLIARVDLGLGAWGGAQKDAARLDIGPTVGVAIPVAGRHVRLAADWRQRVAGNARPGSGPALSLGVDF